MAVRHLKCHWRDSGRIPRFFAVDARVFFPLLAFLLHIRRWTFYTMVLIIIVLAIIERYGFSLAVVWRVIRVFLGGKRRFLMPWWNKINF
jgi:intracellular multiplication protein IcmT